MLFCHEALSSLRCTALLVEKEGEPHMIWRAVSFMRSLGKVPVSPTPFKDLHAMRRFHHPSVIHHRGVILLPRNNAALPTAIV